MILPRIPSSWNQRPKSPDLVMCECVYVGWGVSYMKYNSFWMKMSFREQFRYSYGTTLHKAERERNPLSLCACWHMCKQRSEVDIYNHFFFFLEIVSYWAWNSDIWLDWLAGESQCSGSLCPQSHYTRIFTRVLRVHTQVLPLLQQALQWLSHLSSRVFCVSSPWSQQISTPKFKGENLCCSKI